MSALVDDIKARTEAALRARDDTAKNVLRLVLGEIQTAASRAGSELDEASAHKIVRKLIASNEATLEVTSDEASRARLLRENALLAELIPQPLDVDAIVAALEPVRGAIEGAKADGPAMGAAMKHLKAAGHAVEGGDVKAAVARMRASS